MNTLILVAMLFCLYIEWRNWRVFQFRRRMLRYGYRYAKAREQWLILARYESLPSHYAMVARFWVWPLWRFLG